jgi:hypothetical protein
MLTENQPYLMIPGLKPRPFLVINQRLGVQWCNKKNEEAF